MELRALLITLALLGAPFPSSAQPNPAPSPSAIVSDGVSKQTSEEIAKNPARDNQDRQYYNKVGAIVSEYNYDWQYCRLAVEGAIEPMIAQPPASYIEKGIAGGVTSSLLGGFITFLGRQKEHRDNQRTCLLIKGWRLVKVPNSEVERVASLDPVTQQAWRTARIGSSRVVGELQWRPGAMQPTDPALHLDRPLTEPASVVLENSPDLARPIQLNGDESGLIVAFRRSDPINLGRNAAIMLTRYDVIHRELVRPLSNSKSQHANDSYSKIISSNNQNAQYEIKIIKIAPGDYVIRTLGPQKGFDPSFSAGSEDHCLGTPVIHVSPGNFIYIGDFTPYTAIQLENGLWYDRLLRWTSHIEDARQALAKVHPEVADAMHMADIKNGATYRCVGEAVDALELPGFPDLPAPSSQPGQF